MILLLILFFFPLLVFPLEKKIQRPKERPKEEITLNDENIYEELKKAKLFLRSGKYPLALNNFDRIYKHSRSVIKALEIEKEICNQTFKEKETDQRKREEAYFRLKRIEETERRYNEIRLEAGYYTGFILAKMGNSEKAKDQLLEVLLESSKNEKSPFFENSKILLFDLFGLKEILQ